MKKLEQFIQYILKDPEVLKLYQEIIIEQELPFLEEADRCLLEIALISHEKKEAIDFLFSYLSVNSVKQISYLYAEEDAFIGVIKKNDDLCLVTNKELLSPSLFTKGIAVLLSVIADSSLNPPKCHFLSDMYISDFEMSCLNVNILTNKEDVPDAYQDEYLKVKYHDQDRYYQYMQRFKKEPILRVLYRMCYFNVELALPISFLKASKITDGYLIPYDQFLKEKKMDVRKYDDFPIIKIEDRIYTIEPEVYHKDGKTCLRPKYQSSEEGLVIPSKEAFEECIKDEEEFAQEFIHFISLINGYFIPEPIDPTSKTCYSLYENYIYLIGESIRNENVSKYNHYRNILNTDKVSEYYRLLQSKNKSKDPDEKNPEKMLKDFKK